MPRTMSFAAYARHAGVSRNAVSKAISSGRIGPALRFSGTRQVLDVEQADKLWAERTTPKIDVLLRRRSRG